MQVKCRARGCSHGVHSHHMVEVCMSIYDFLDRKSHLFDFLKKCARAVTGVNEDTRA